ncbi:hypothetical protein Tco_0899953 [Tanacetum coccineum]
MKRFPRIATVAGDDEDGRWRCYQWLIGVRIRYLNGRLRKPVFFVRKKMKGVVIITLKCVKSQVQLILGGLTNGYQESTTIYSASLVGYSLVSSIRAQRMASQMIPTPGLNNNNNGNSSSYQSYMNMVVSGIGEHTNQQWE